MPPPSGSTSGTTDIMKPTSKSDRRESLPVSPSTGAPSSGRRRFLKQTLAAGVAGVGIGEAKGQTPKKRATPHKSPSRKKDPRGKLPKDLKQAMEWDFERFVVEVIEQITQGKTTKEIDAWIYTAGAPVDQRQVVEIEVEDGPEGEKKKHPLGVCMEAPIEWKMDGDEISGFIIRGRLGRQLTGEPLECDAYGPEENAAAGGPSAAQALVFSGSLPQAPSGQRLVAGVGGPSSSSSSSSSSSWPRP